jgi:hypothetical protein
MRAFFLSADAARAVTARGYGETIPPKPGKQRAEADAL